MPARKLKQFLDREGVKYVTIAHSPAYTAPEIAHSVHVPGRALAKTVMVKLDGRMAMAVLPSSCTVDLELLRRHTGASDVELADEREFSERDQEMEQWLNRVPDDPAGLLREKLRRRYAEKRYGALRGGL